MLFKYEQRSPENYMLVLLLTPAARNLMVDFSVHMPNTQIDPRGYDISSDHVVCQSSQKQNEFFLSETYEEHRFINWWWIILLCHVRSPVLLHSPFFFSVK